MNVYKPLIIYNFLHAVRLLSDSCRSFREHCAVGIQVDEARVARYVDECLMLVTALNPVVGYDKAAKIAKTAHVDGSSLREAATKLGFLTGEEFDRHMVPEAMTKAG